jgi:hypothetical protein
VPDPAGALPNLVVAGVTKAGTSSLHHYLGQHPGIGLADLKEVDHYAPMVEGAEPPSLEEYARHFRGCADATWRLDASPRYFIGGPPLVRRLTAELDRPRVLIALREPVARMWSSYTYKRSKSRLPSDMRFPQFAAECRRVHDEGSVRDPRSAAYRTLASGVYADFLDDWFDELGDQVRVVFFDDLADSPLTLVSELCTWLDLDPAPVAGFDLAGRNATVQPRSQALKRAAQRANAQLRRVVPEDSALSRSLRRTYLRLNSAALGEQPDPEEQERLHAFYAPSLVRLREQLSAHGHSRLPGWLSEARV